FASLCFFFQAEDGIRDRNVTGVQTCALPISSGWSSAAWLSTCGLEASGLEASGLEASGLSAFESESFGSDIAKDGFGSALLWPLGSDMAKDGFSDFGWSSTESSSVQSPACCPKLKPISGSSLEA